MIVFMKKMSWLPVAVLMSISMLMGQEAADAVNQVTEAEQHSASTDNSEIKTSFKYGGYFRAGTIQNSLGKAQTDTFRLPGVAGYRLGNEAPWGEFSFVNRWEKGNLWAEAFLFLGWPIANNRANERIPGLDLQGATITIGFADSGLSLWGGLRSYNNEDIHINDWNYREFDGIGGGVDNIPLPFGKLDVGYLNSADLNNIGAEGKLTKSTFYLGLKEVMLNEELGLTFDFHVRPSFIIGGPYTNAVNADTNIPFSGGVRLETGIKVQKFLFALPGSHRIFFQYGLGTGAYQSADVNNNEVANIATTNIYKRMNFRAIVNGTWDIMDQLSLAHNVFYTLNIDALGQAADTALSTHWISTGLRPHLSITDFFAVQLEYGLDVKMFTGIQPEPSTELLQKVTLAPTFTIARGMMVRPQIRPFITFAFWNEGAKGKVGGPVYSVKTFGFIYGINVEAWW